jgi:hypothetical protein
MSGNANGHRFFHYINAHPGEWEQCQLCKHIREGK